MVFSRIYGGGGRWEEGGKLTFLRALSEFYSLQLPAEYEYYLPSMTSKGAGEIIIKWGLRYYCPDYYYYFLIRILERGIEVGDHCNEHWRPS